MDQVTIFTSHLVLWFLCLGAIHSYNFIEKYDLHKAKVVDNKLDEIVTSIKDLKAEVTSLKRINKKLLKRFYSKGLMGDVPVKELGKQDTLPASLLSGPLVKTTNRCPQTFELSTHGSCYHIEAECVTWVKANNMCKAIGGDLVSIETHSEHAYIVDVLKNSKVYRHCDVWTSGSDAGHEGEWKWKLRHQEKPMTYTKWQPDEPNNGGGDEHCMWMDWYFSWSWNDAKCDKSKACFICEVQRTLA